MTTTTPREPSTWWLKAACFSFFAGLACFVPLLTAHLQWLGFDLQEIGIINVIASTGAVLGLALAGAWSPRCGHRSNLAIAFLLAAFCGAGLALVPRLNGRAHGRVETERPVAEILCRPEGSALFFRKCGDSCELDAVTRTELSVTDCRFEPQFRLPVNFLELMNRFALTHINSGKGSMDGDDDDLSEPERGDLPQKVPAQAVGHVEEETDPLADIETVDDTLFPDQSGSYSSSGVAPYEYDYDENHRQDTILPERQKRQIVPLMADDDGLGLHHRHFDDELEIAERADLPHTSSPHICFSSYSSSTTTCHVFTGTNHLFRFNTSFFSGITHNGQCFYSLNYDDVDNQILSELRCRSNKPNHQVRCRAEGMKLRASVTRNGTSTCHGQPLVDNFHLVFWLYLIFRTCGEIAAIGAVLLLRIVTLNEDHDRTDAATGTSWTTQKRSPIILWWSWGLFGLVGLAPLAGWVADVVSFGIAFLLGSVMLGLAALCMALSPAQMPARPHPILAATLAIEEEEDGIVGGGIGGNSQPKPIYRISCRDLRAILSDSTAVLILVFVSLMGMAAAVVPTLYYWYLLDLGATRLILGASVSAQWIVIAPVVLLLSRWLWRRCGHCYIFIIGLLLYAIRFLAEEFDPELTRLMIFFVSTIGYTLLDWPLYLVAIETLEPLCSLWIMLTAAARIEQLENRTLAFSGVFSRADGCRTWKVNAWALIILFHYALGRGLGGLTSAYSAHHFGVTRTFVAAALISLFTAACWFLWIHLKSPCQSKGRKNAATTAANSQFPKGQLESPKRQPKENQKQMKNSLV